MSLNDLPITGSDGESYSNLFEGLISQNKYFKSLGISPHTKFITNQLQDLIKQKLTYLIEFENKLTLIIKQGHTEESFASIFEFDKFVQTLPGNSFEEKLFSFIESLGFPGEIIKNQVFNSGSTGDVRITDFDNNGQAYFMTRDYKLIHEINEDNMGMLFIKRSSKEIYYDHFVLTKPGILNSINLTTSDN